MFETTRTTFRHVGAQLKRQWRLFGLGIAALVATNLMVQLRPLLLLHAIDDLAGGAAIAVVLLWALLRLGAVLVMGALRFGWRYGFFGMGRRVEHGLRRLFFDRLLVFSPSFYNRWLKGDLLSRAMSDLQTIRESIGFGWLALFDSSTAILFTIPFMAVLDAELTLWCLAPMLLIPPIVATLGRRIRRGSEELQSRLDKLSQAATESFSGVRVIQAYARRGQEIERFRRQCLQYRDRSMDLVKMEAFFWPLLVFITAICELILFYRGGMKVAAGQLTLGQFVALFDYLAVIGWPVMASGFVTNQFIRGKVSAERINEVVDAPAGLDVGAAAPAGPSPSAALLRFDKVRFAYQQGGPEVLRGLSLDLKAGQWLGIAGPTGAGKSSLLRLTARLYDPTAGRVLLDGVDLRQWDLAQLRAQLGMVTQEPFLFSETVGENIQFGAPQLDSEALRRFAGAADLAETLEELPAGLDTLLGEKGVNLSGGQKQRVALARAMAVRPRLLLLDDSFSAVDTLTEARIVSGLRDELPHSAVLLVSHRISTLALCDRVLVLENGQVSDLDRPAALLERDGFYQRMARREQLARRTGLALEEE